MLFRSVTGLLLCGCLVAAAGQNQPADRKAEGQGHPSDPGSQGPAQGRDGAFGTIASVGVDRLEIKKMDGTAQTVMVNDQTQYQEGRRDAPKNLHLEDLKPGDRVLAVGKEAGGQFVADRVMTGQLRRGGGPGADRRERPEDH